MQCKGLFGTRKKIVLKGSQCILYTYLYPVHTQSIFRNKRFVLNEMSKRNVSKFAVLYLPLYVNLEQGIHKAKKVKVKSHEMKIKKYCRVFPAHKIIQQILKHLAGVFFSSRNLLFLKSVLTIVVYRYLCAYVQNLASRALGQIT